MAEACRAGRRALRGAFSAHARRPRGVPRQRPRPATRATTSWRATSARLVRAARGAGGTRTAPGAAAGRARSPPRALLHQGGHAAQDGCRTTIRPTHYARPGGAQGPLGAGDGRGAGHRDAIRALRRDLNVILSRAVWQVFGIAAARYRRTLEARGVLDFSELLIARADAARQHGRVRPQPLPARGAVPSRARGRVPGHVARAVGAGLAARAGLGRGPGPGADDAAPAVDLHRRRPEAVDLRRSAMPTWRVLDEAAADIGALRPDGHPLRSITRSFRSVPAAAGVRQRPLRRGRRRRRGPPRRVPLRRTRRVSDRGRRRRSRRTDPRSGSSRPTTCASAAAAVAAEIARLARGALVRDRQTGRPPADPSPATSPSCSGRARAIASSSRRSRRAGSRPTSTRGSASSTPTRSRTSWRSLQVPGRPASDLRAAAFLRSRLVRLSDPGAPAPRARHRRGADAAAPRRRPSARLDAEDAARAGARRASSRRGLARPGRSRAAGGTARPGAGGCGLRVRAARAPRPRRRART